MGSWSRKPQRTRLSLAVALSATVAGLAAGMLGTAGEARATAAPSFGVQFHATWSDYTDAQRADVLDKLKAAGVTWVRIDLGWASLQEYGRSSYSKWYVDLADSVVDAARARGIHVLGTLWSTPAWANGGRGTNVPPTDVNDYARIANWAAAHFRGRVEAWEVWNEPNLADFFTGDVAMYARLLRAAYPAFKSGDSRALVVFGGPSANDTAYLAKAYAAGIRGSFDVMATHPYQGVADAPPEKPDDGTKYTLSHVRAVHDLMARQGDGGKPIWFTEFGWSSHANWAGVENWNRGVTPQQQGDYLVRTIKYVTANFPYVTNMFWYNERNLSTGAPQLDNYGLLDRSLAPKPAYFSLRAQLTGAKSTAFTSAAGPKSGRSRALEAHHGKRHARVAAPHWVKLRR